MDIKEILAAFAKELTSRLPGAPMSDVPGTEWCNGNTEIGFYADQQIDPEWLDAEIDKLCEEFAKRQS